MNFNEACRAIIANANERALNYAVGYARAGYAMLAGSDEARVQSLYILNNMSHWRGDTAKQVRAALKAEAGVK